MRLPRSFAFLAMTILLAGACTAASPIKPTFDTKGADEMLMPHDARWSVWAPADPELKVTSSKSDVSRSGETSFLLEVAKDGKPDFYRFETDITTMEPGELYEFSAWVKTESLDGFGAFVALAAFDEAGKRFVANQSGYLWDTKDWTWMDCVFFVPDEAVRVQPGLYMHGTGKAWFDQVVLRKISARSSAAQTPKINVRVTDEPTVPGDQFIGFGLEDDCFFYMEDNMRHGITEDDIALRDERIAEMAPKIIATLFWWASICPTWNLDEITYDTDLMRAMYRTLDVHQAAGREVIISDVFWGPWAAGQDFLYNDKNVEKGVAAYVGLYKHLIIDKGYTCIKSISISGEVDIRWEKEFKATMGSYIKACRLLREGLDALGLHDVRVVGDKVTGTAWFERVIEAGDEHYDIFTVHEYPDVTQYPTVDDRFAKALDAIHRSSAPIKQTPRGPIYKPTFLWEIGFVSQGANDPSGESSVVGTFDYGLLCANTCNSSLNAGLVGGSVWCLQQMYYPGAPRPQSWGFWEFKNDEGQWPIRPFYYAYGLYSRFADTGMTPLAVATGPDCHDFSASALQDADGGKMLYLTNLSDGEVECSIDGLPDATYAIYEYAEDRVPAPDNPLYARIDALRTGKTWRPSDGALTLRPQTLVLLR